MAKMMHPKRGKGRLAVKTLRGGKVAMGKKAREYASIPYSPTPEGGIGVRADRVRWSRNVMELYQATEKQINNMLLKDCMLHNWKGKHCPRCSVGVLGPLKVHPGRQGYLHRCNRKACHVYITPQHLHPVFTDGRGSRKCPLQLQAAQFFCKVAGASNPTVHALLDVNHKAVESMDKRWNLTLKQYVEQEEKNIQIGDGVNWCEAEADEATFRKGLDEAGVGTYRARTKKIPKKRRVVAWEQWGGIIQRGKRRTLVLQRLRSNLTTPRAPGPGAIKQKAIGRNSGSSIWKVVVSSFTRTKPGRIGSRSATVNTMS